MGDQMFSVTDLNTLWLRLAVSERDVVGLRVGQRVEIRSQAIDREITGAITWISSRLDETTRMAEVRAEVANPDRSLRAGMFVDANIAVGESAVSLLLPRDTVHRFGGNPFVFVRLSGDLYELRRVETTPASQNLTAVTAGLTEHDLVAVEQSYLLKSEFQKSRLGAGLVVSVLFLVAALLGVRALLTLPVDAFPDTTPVQVQINTVAPALNPEEIERQITFPVETGISGLPGLENVRSISKFGFSQVVATFDDGTSIYDARQLILERLGTVRLPEGIEPPSLGPIATGLGEVFHYIVRSPDASQSLSELRTIHDWIIKPELRRVAGVAEVNSWGGYEKQHEVVVEPEALIAYHLTLQTVVGALQANNRNVGGGRIVSSGDALLLHGVGRLTTTDEIANVVITSHDGVPVRIRDVADVGPGHEIRRGAVTAGGGGEAVLGLAFMLMGENSKEVTQHLKQQVDDIRGALPEGVTIDVIYDRTELVDHVITTVKHNLFLGAILVIVRNEGLCNCGQPSEPRCDRLRDHRRWLGRHGGKQYAAACGTRP
jgi:hypothetical protein